MVPFWIVGFARDSLLGDLVMVDEKKGPRNGRDVYLVVYFDKESHTFLNSAIWTHDYKK